MTAAIEGDKESMEFLLQYGANVNLTRYDGKTALTLAIEWKSEAKVNPERYDECVELLLEHTENGEVANEETTAALAQLGASEEAELAALPDLESPETDVADELF